MNCLYCGKISPQKYCSVICEDKEKQMFNLSNKWPLYFNSMSQVAKFFNRDRRTMKKYEGTLFVIDKKRIAKDNLSINKTKVIYKQCSICNKLEISSKCRKGYCQSCSKKGLGKKEQGKKISKMYKGKGNPNYTNGKSNRSFRNYDTKAYKNWRENVLKFNKHITKEQLVNCVIHTHHILPHAFFPEFNLKVWNGVALTEFHHIQLHRLQLDVVLLPILHSQLERGVLNLREYFLHLPQVQSVLQLPVEPVPEHELLRVVPSNYHKTLQSLHPQFAQQVLNLEV